MFTRKWNRKLLYIIIVTTLALIVVSGGNVLLFYLLKERSGNNFIYNQNNTIPQAVRTFYKQNTVSLTFLKGTNSKVSGTSWLKKVENGKFYFSTNLHVVRDFVKFNYATKHLEFDPSVSDKLNVKYYNEVNDNELFIARTDISDWSINLNLSIINVPNSQKPSEKGSNCDGAITTDSTYLIKRQIPKKEYENHNNNKYNWDNTCLENGEDLFITNGYIDYIELIYDPYKDEELSYFDEWLLAKDPNSLAVSKMLNGGKDKENNDEGLVQINDGDIFCVMGFPTDKNDITWKEKTVTYKKPEDTNNSEDKKGDVYLSSARNQLGLKKWLGDDDSFFIYDEINEKIHLRSVSRQLILKNLDMGPGSSGSMVSKYRLDENNNVIPNSIEIVGIWWGQYKGSASIFSGGCDLFYTPAFDPFKDSQGSTDAYSYIGWEGYKIKD